MPEWKDTVNLPRTEFPMKANLPTSEPVTLARWKAIDLYGNSVRGRLTVSFHSGMGIHRFYNVWMRRTTLDNGLKVLIQEEHTAPLASVWCWYRVGSKDERPGLTGVSHWCEHMNFKGTENIPRDQVQGIIEQYGGSWNS